MTFFDEIKSLEATSKAQEEMSSLLKILIEQHKRTLLNKHLQAVYEEMKESIRQRITEGTLRRDEDGERLLGSYKFKAYVPMNYDFEPPYPEGVTSRMVKDATRELKGVGTISRVRIEPTLELKKKKSIGFGIRVKYIGEIYFEGDAYDFFESLEKMMNDDGMELLSITAPVVNAGRLVTLSHRERLKCSYTERAESRHSLTYEELSYITVRFSINM